MKPFIGSVFMVFALFITACPSSSPTPDHDPNQPSADFLIGEWQDNDSTTYTFANVDGSVKLTSIVDDDGEVFELRDFAYKAGYYSFTYFVPSTGYVVTIRVLEREGTELGADWTNSAGETGPERLVKQ